VRTEELQNQARRDFRYGKTLMARLAPFLKKEVAKKEATKKEVAEKEVTEKEVAENRLARVIFIMTYFYF
jgi:hypothetical protein